ncbi:MAG: metallopeptidase family protein [Candidatus Pacebacteria bacterium]|nr:metallopeptidase family protein [Candidatus Paceibacterota bacterium]
MSQEEFEKLIEEEFPKAVPEKFHALLKNVAFLAEWEPSAHVRQEEGLKEGETLLGLYHGVPHTARGDYYGVGGTLPDTITLYQGPIEEEAAELVVQSQKGQMEGKTWPSGPERAPDDLFGSAVRKVVRETIWHEVAHYMGYDEHQVRGREDERDNGKL